MIKLGSVSLLELEHKDRSIINWIRDCVGAILGGAISGFGFGLISSFVLGGVGEMVETLFSGEATEDNMVSTFFSGAFSGVISYGIGEGFKYLGCLLEIGAGKLASKIFSNNKVNRFISKTAFEGIKIGTKRIGKLLSQVAAVEGNTFVDIVSALGAGGYSWLENLFVTQFF